MRGMSNKYTAESLKETTYARKLECQLFVEKKKTTTTTQQPTPTEKTLFSRDFFSF